MNSLPLIGEFTPQSLDKFFYDRSDFYTPIGDNKPDYDDDLFQITHNQGEFIFSNGDKVIVYSIFVSKELTERSCRQRQFKKAKDIIDGHNANAGIFLFYDKNFNLRFSLVHQIYQGSKRKWTNYKRLSYFVVPVQANKTFIQQLNPKSEADKRKLFSDLNHVKDAFSVSKVSEFFYSEFIKQFNLMSDNVISLVINKVETEKARDFTLLFAIRIIFLAFIQKRGWLNNDLRFLQNYLKSYKDYGKGGGFYLNWLCPLFFDALNKSPLDKQYSMFASLPELFQKALVRAPYLNGGLFTKHELYDNDVLSLQDEVIEEFFGFLFSFNITIEENTLYDEELELNPEFLGIIFEKLVNKEAGAIYTPRLEVDFMCKISLIKWLQQNCQSGISTQSLYELFFPEYGSDADQTYGDFTKEQATEVVTRLENVTICDPAVGTGAFLVGMLNVLDETECTLYDKFLNEKIPLSRYERKKRTIFQSLYGVEVKQWAVWISQLRLWITLFIDAPDEVRNSAKAILPSFDFKIRQGDSLVQRLGSHIFPIDANLNITANVKSKITQLITHKAEFFNNQHKHNQHDISKLQLEVFKEIIWEEIKGVEKLITAIRNDTKEHQGNLFDYEYQSEVKLSNKKQEMELSALEYKKAELEYEFSQLKASEIPFIWTIDFPEIFRLRKGFDIVIGNPPYIAQEDISDPQDKIKNNKEYKDMLRDMAASDFPKDINSKAINARSDLYTFFYIRGIKLLSSKGILTFICSNSWLDVEFGAWLQSFLLQHCPVHFIIDNIAKRVFKNADINTIISIMGAYQKQLNSNQYVRFGAFKLPFEECLYTENLLLMEETKSFISYDDINVKPVKVSQLWENGLEPQKGNQLDNSKLDYQGSKWGSVYIKAPDIYFTILEKAKGKLVRLGDIADVARGFTTGADEFFYIPKDNPHHIEPEFLKPVIKSPRECKSILINPDELKLWLFMCPYEKKDIKGTNALKYIEWGETAEKYIKQGKDKGTYIKGIQNISSVQGRKNWYDVGERKYPELIIPSSFGDTYKVYLNNGVYANKRLYEIHYDGDKNKLVNILNSTLFFILLEVNSSSGLGEGLLDKTVNEVQSTYTINPDLVTLKVNMDYLSEIRPIPQDGSEIYRTLIDEIIFDVIGLTSTERKLAVKGLKDMVESRLSKAVSLN